MITLRKMLENDAELVLNWRNSPDVSQYMYGTHIIEHGTHKRWMQETIKDKTRIYLVIELDAEPCGLVYVYDINNVHKRCYWGYYIGSAKFRGQGVGSSVEFAILNFVFDTLQLNKLCCEVLRENEAVWKLHLRFGFSQEGLYREHIARPQGFVDVVSLGILAREWKKIEPQLRQKFSSKAPVVPKNI